MASSDVRETSVSFVHQRIKQDIVSGEISPGAPLRLQDLALRHGVSMSPVREALRLLEVEGLVESNPNRGARVTPLSYDDLVDANRTRLALETEAIRRGLDGFRPDDIAASRALNEKLRARGEGESPESRAIHRAFHLSLARPSNSPRLKHFLEIVWDQTERYRSLPGGSDAYEICLVQHDQIVDAIAARQLDVALARLTEHLEIAIDQQRDLFANGDLFSPVTPHLRKSGANRPVSPRVPRRTPSS